MTEWMIWEWDWCYVAQFEWDSVELLGLGSPAVLPHMLALISINVAMIQQMYNICGEGGWMTLWMHLAASVSQERSWMIEWMKWKWDSITLLRSDLPAILPHMLALIGINAAIILTIIKGVWRGRVVGLEAEFAIGAAMRQGLGLSDCFRELPICLARMMSKGSLAIWSEQTLIKKILGHI